MVWLLTLLKRRLPRCRKGAARIFDESAFAGGQNEGGTAAAPATPVDRARGGVSALLAIVFAPLSLVSCLSRPPDDGADGVWTSGEFSRIEMDYLMVSDGMRYAIYV